MSVPPEYLPNNHTTRKAVVWQKILSRIRTVQTFAGYFDRATSSTAVRELRAVELRDAVGEFLDVVRPDLNRSGITVAGPTFLGPALFAASHASGRMDSILFNLFTNSKKAIQRTNHNGRSL